MELNTNELRLIQPGGKEMREYAENTQGYYAAKGLHGSVPDDSEKKILAEMYAPEESTEMHFPGVIIAATKDGEVLGHIRLGEPCRGEVAVCCRFRENGAYAAEALKAVAGEALRSSGVNRLAAVCPAGDAQQAHFLKECGFVEKKSQNEGTRRFMLKREQGTSLFIICLLAGAAIGGLIGYFVFGSISGSMNAGVFLGLASGITATALRAKEKKPEASNKTEEKQDKE